MLLAAETLTLVTFAIDAAGCVEYFQHFLLFFQIPGKHNILLCMLFIFGGHLLDHCSSVPIKA